MNRVLALQGLSSTPVGFGANNDSNQSHHCSSATTECSTQSAGCGGIMEALAW